MPKNVKLASVLCCPRCDHREVVSGVDPDASLSEMDWHFRRDHPNDNAMELLSEVYEVIRRA